MIGFRTTIIWVGVYHHPKETTIVQMVVDFQEIPSIALFFQVSKSADLI